MKTSYWNSDKFISMFGSPFYGAVSTSNDGITFDGQNMVYLGLEYSKSFGKGFSMGVDEEFDFDSIFGIDQLDLNYEAHVAGFDGESFLYSVHIDGGVTDEKVDEIQQVMADYSSQNGDEENYMGYIDIYNGEDQIMIYLDLGGVSEENSNMAVTGILNALNSVSGIKSVIINEGM